MINIAIIEDEKIAADYLEKLILSFPAEITVMAKLDDVSSAVDFLSKNKPDLLFCDIHLGDDISFSIFNQIEVTAPVIFTTAFDQYAIKAFKVNSIDYLLKPINKDELFAAINKFQQSSGNPNKNIDLLLNHFTQTQNYQQRFLVSSGTDVAYFFFFFKLNFLVEKTGKQYIVDSSLDKLEPMLNPTQFFRINRQFIISFDSIKSMINYSKSRIKIELNPPIERETIVSVERSPDFKNWLNR